MLNQPCISQVKPISHDNIFLLVYCYIWFGSFFCGESVSMFISDTGLYLCVCVWYLLSDFGIRVMPHGINLGVFVLLQNFGRVSER